MKKIKKVKRYGSYHLKENIALILKSVRQYRKPSIITPIFIVGEAIMEAFLPFMMAELVNLVQYISKPEDMLVVLPQSDYKISLLGIICILVAMTVVSLLCGIFAGVFAAKAGVGFSINLRNDLYKKIQSFSFENIDKFSSASLITRLTTDVNNIQMSYQNIIRNFVRTPLMIIFCAVMAFITGGPLAWIFVALIPILTIGFAAIGKSTMSIFARFFKRLDKVNAQIEENVSGIRVVKSYVREDYEKEKFNMASTSLKDEASIAEKILALINPMMNTTIHVSNILILFIGPWLIITSGTAEYIAEQGKVIYNGLSPAQISALLTYGIQILTNLMFLSMIAVVCVMSIESVKRVGEVLKEEPTIVNPENPLYDVPNGDVTFKNVSFKYSQKAEHNTLSDININIKSGQYIGVLGGTGSGKTSIINLISRLYDTTQGSVLVADQDVRNYDLKTLRDNVSVVLQKNVLFSGTIRSNLQWGNENATEEEMWKACKIAQAEEIVKAKPDQLDSKVEQGGTNFSGGQKQRLCIARALLKKPKILILDDSTSAVDTKTDKLIRKGLKEDLPEMTKIVIAQRISSIEDADQIIILHDGAIDQIGTHEQLLKSNAIYQEIYATQNRAGGVR